MDILRKNIVVHRMMSHTSPAWQAFEREGKESITYLAFPINKVVISCFSCTAGNSHLTTMHLIKTVDNQQMQYQGFYV